MFLFVFNVLFCFFVDAKRIDSCNRKDAKRIIIMGSNSTFILLQFACLVEVQHVDVENREILAL